VVALEEKSSAVADEVIRWGFEEEDKDEEERA